MSSRSPRLSAGVSLAILSAVLLAPSAAADEGWVAVANSPQHEQVDFAYGPDQYTAEANAFIQCTRLERASDCRVLASSPNCVAVAWDGEQPINQLHGASGGGPEIVIGAAMSAAGPYANDPAVRCTWFQHS